MKRFNKLSFLLTAFFLLSSITQAQFGLKTQPESSVKTVLATATVPPSNQAKALPAQSSDGLVPIEKSRSEISTELIKAATSLQRKGEITRLQLVRIRVAMLSPAFRAKVEDLAVVQMAASGEDGPFSVDENGEIVRETINWEGLAAFLEKLVPLVLALIKAFGG